MEDIYNSISYFLILIGSILAFLFIATRISNLNYVRNLKYKIEKFYGHFSNDEKFTIESIEKLFKLCEKSDYIVDDITFNDLNLMKVFKKLNHTRSILGSQYFYKIFREQNFDLDQLYLNREIRDFFISNETLAKKFQLEFAKLGKIKGHLLEILVSDNDISEDMGNLKIPVYISTFTIPIIFLLSLVSGLLVFIFGPLLILLNIYLFYHMKKKTQGRVDDFSAINYILNLATSISKMDAKIIKKDLDRISELNSKFKSIKRGAAGLVQDSFTGEIGVLADFLDILFMFRSRQYFRITNKIYENKKELLELYILLGKIDFLVSLSSLYKSGKFVDVTYADDENILKAEGLLHPLIVESQVPASFDFTNESIIITGSNASGKSTFLRNVAIANVMAFSLSFVFAKDYKTSKYLLQTSIDISDSISENLSYFLAETVAIKRMIKEEEIRKLIILDEIFKGTNTIDRISAATYTLLYLENKNKVIAATHDIELTKILENNFSNYHFEENIVDDDIKFDYLIKKGPATSRNAIKILKIKGYPDEIVEKAESMAKNMEEEKQKVTIIKGD